jgi:hypothetical protein
VNRWKPVTVTSSGVSEQFEDLKTAIEWVYENGLPGPVMFSQLGYPDERCDNVEKFREFAASCGIVFIEPNDVG